MNRYPIWKYVLLLVALVIGIIYALPNVYGEDPSVQISSAAPGTTLNTVDEQAVQQALSSKHLPYESIRFEGKSIVIRFDTIDQQTNAQDYLKAYFQDKYLIAISLAPAAPAWLQAVGANPMRLGLDLRGGIHFLLQIDTDSITQARLQSDVRNIADMMRDKHLRYSGITPQPKSNAIHLNFTDETTLNAAEKVLNDRFSEYAWREGSNGNLLGQLTPIAVQNVQQYTVEQTIETLKRRVNELGITEATVQQQGADRISVDMPGIQDATQAKNILGKTATLEFHLQDVEHDPMMAVQGVPPVGSQLYMYNGQPVLLQDQVILTGDAITNASSGFDMNGRPAVNIQLGGAGESNFYRITGENVGKPLAVVYIETKSTPVTLANGQTQITYKQDKQVINIATIQSALPGNFQVTGLSSTDEAKNLALLLRAGALVAPVTIIAENNVGPSMGQQNIHQGMMSIAIGLALVVVFMAIYYGVFGIIADIGLLLNMVFLVAIMSLLGAVLSFPGIAGMVLTLGMAVDANVLIFERIREELRMHVSVQAAIQAGYEKAFATIVDANVTTLIAAIVLFSLGTGPIKGFAITLTIGIITSMFTAVTCTRAIVNLLFGGKRINKLPIGIKVKPLEGANQ